MNDVFHALSHPARRNVLALLKERAISAGEIADRLGIAKPTLSGHLNILKAADLVSVERQGTTLIYRVNVSVLEDGLAGAMDLFTIGNDAIAKARRRLSKTSKKGKTV